MRPREALRGAARATGKPLFLGPDILYFDGRRYQRVDPEAPGREAGWLVKLLLFIAPERPRDLPRPRPGTLTCVGGLLGLAAAVALLLGTRPCAARPPGPR